MNFLNWFKSKPKQTDLEYQLLLNLILKLEKRVVLLEETINIIAGVRK